MSIDLGRTWDYAAASSKQPYLSPGAQHPLTAQLLSISRGRRVLCGMGYDSERPWQSFAKHMRYCLASGHSPRHIRHTPSCASVVAPPASTSTVHRSLDRSEAATLFNFNDKKCCKTQSLGGFPRAVFSLVIFSHVLTGSSFSP